MFSEKEIEKGFELLGLLDENERRKFEQLTSLIKSIEREQPYSFIETSSVTEKIDQGGDYA